MAVWRKGDPHYVHPNPEMLESTAAIADFLGVGYQRARDWIKYNQLPAVRNQSGRWLTSKRAVLAWALEGAESGGMVLHPDLKALLKVAQERVIEIYGDSSLQKQTTLDSLNALVTAIGDISEPSTPISGEDGIEKPSIKLSSN